MEVINNACISEGIDKLASESFTGNVNDIEVRVIFSYLVSDGSDKVGLAHTRRAVDEQRIVVGNSLFSAVFSHGFTAGKGKFIGSSLDEGIEGVVIVCKFIGLFKLLMLHFKLGICRDIELFRLISLYLDDNVYFQTEDIEKSVLQYLVICGHNDIFLELGLNAENSLSAVEVKGNKWIYPCFYCNFRYFSVFETVALDFLKNLIK